MTGHEQPLGPASEVFIAPTSFAQQRLWFLDQLAPGNASYNLDTALQMEMRPADVPVLERTLKEIVGRHESLRTTFTAVDGQPMQVISPHVAVSLPVIDLRHVSSGSREEEVLRLATEEARRSFDMATGPLMRTTLLRTGERAYVFLVTMHHIISDGWSVGVFWQELFAVWDAFARGLPSPLRELPIRYADFAVWQHTFLSEGAGASNLAYWATQLADLPVTSMPTDWPRPATQSFMGATHGFWLPSGLHAELQALSHAEGVTLFMTLLAAFQALLHRYTGQDDIVVGAPIANRNRAEIEGIIGFFVNALVLRTDVSGDPTFRVLLQRVREVALAGYAHQDLPFERLVQELQPERDMSRNPLFQISFQLFSATDRARARADDEDQLEVSKGTANIDFALDLWEYADGLYATIEYSTDLFEVETINRIAGHYQTLLEHVVEDPTARLSRLSILTGAERTQLVEWNATVVPRAAASVHGLFEAQARRTPKSTAVVYGDQRLSYAALNERSSRLAHWLIAAGAGPGEIVGVCLERSLDVPVALLAVLKSGAAYLPLEPSHPPERLAFMTSEVMPRLVLTQSHLESRLGSDRGRCVKIDADAHLWDAEPRFNPDVPVGPDDLAYVMYTSGSTGLPKGVLVAHRSVCNHLSWAHSTLPLDASDRVVQSTPWPSMRPCSRSSAR